MTDRPEIHNTNNERLLIFNHKVTKSTSTTTNQNQSKPDSNKLKSTRHEPTKCIKLKNYPTFTVTTVNVKTAKDDTQLQYFISRFDSKNLDIVCLQEVHRIGNDSARIKSIYSDTVYDIFWQGHSRYHQQGVAICIKKSPNIQVLEIAPSSNARIMTAYVRVYGYVLKIVNIYAPTDSTSRPTKLKFYRELRAAVESKSDTVCEKKAKLIICGDFNARVNASTYKSNLNYDTALTLPLEFSENGELMLEMIKKYKLNTLNTFFTHKLVRRTTRITPDVSKANQIIDYIHVCDNLKNYALNCRVFRSILPENEKLSDHHALVTTFRVPPNKHHRP